MILKQTLIYTVAVVVVSVAVTKYLWPTVETQIRIEEKEVIKKDIRTIIRERTNPDGSKEKETEIIDRSKEKREREVEQITNKRKEWFVAVGTGLSLKDIKPMYNLQVNRRILGPIYLGTTINTNKEIGVQVGLEF